MMYSAYKLNKQGDNILDVLLFLFGTVCCSMSRLLLPDLHTGLKLNIQKTKIMASGPITSWQIDGETMETVTEFIFWDSKITTDGDCSHKIKRRFLLGRKVMTNLDSILKKKKKNRHYFANKGPSSQSYGFPSSHVWM